MGHCWHLPGLPRSFSDGRARSNGGVVMIIMHRSDALPCMHFGPLSFGLRLSSRAQFPSVQHASQCNVRHSRACRNSGDGRTLMSDYRYRFQRLCSVHCRRYDPRTASPRTPYDFIVRHENVLHISGPAHLFVTCSSQSDFRQQSWSA